MNLTENGTERLGKATYLISQAISFKTSKSFYYANVYNKVLREGSSVQFLPHLKLGFSQAEPH